MPGFFIAFEGIDGCGKFTQLEKTKKWLKELGFSVHSSSEPNEDYPLGRTIKEMLRGKSKIPKPESVLEFQRLYILDRAQSIICFIKPALEEPNSIYLIERFALSTFAYGMLSGETAEVFMNLHNETMGPAMLWPDLTILIDIPAKTAMRRINANRSETELFEKEKTLERVRRNYIFLLGHWFFKDKVILIDGEASEDEVFENVKRVVSGLIHNRAFA
ncbi:MAG: dTMP kinase [Patescibacteria group bacterium]